MKKTTREVRILNQIRGKSWNNILFILRENAEYTQERVAKELGVTRKTYRKYENGLWEIKLKHLITLSRFYDVPVSIIAGRYSIDQSFWKEIERNEKNK